eukprot:Phypoly_transcript_09157.p1 GENE.Phypoly_transcript_09157~~Phypoly_transcript_09157.p1  ORF type:complete len:432 (+),score=49.83 Phypoly_transcript_09157:54-1349(+)
MDMMDLSMDKHHQDQKDFINNPEMSDVVFLIGDEKIYAHRALMGMHSKVFRTMLFNGMKESSQSEIPLLDVEKDTFLQLLGYIYCGTVPNDASLSVLVSILAAADKFDMPPLKEICKQQIEAFLREDTVLDVLISATMFNSWELKLKCYEIIDVNTNTIFNSKGFLSLSAEVIEDILKRDQIRCEELAAFKALMMWAKHNCPEDMKENLADLVTYIRFPLMRPCDLYSIVEPEGVVPEVLLLEAYRYASLDPDLKRTVQSPRTKPRAAISEYPVFDTTLQATITLSNDYKAVSKRGAQGYAVVLAKYGYSTGVHRWRLRADGLASNQWISVGVARSKTSRTNYVDANHWAVSSAFQVYCASQVDSASGNGILIGNLHVLECSLDMHIGLFEVRNITSGTAVTLSVPVNEELFPAVGLHTLGNKVWFCDYSM